METNNTFSSSVSSLLNRWGVGGGPKTSTPTTPTTATSGGGAKSPTSPPKKLAPTPAPKGATSLSVTNTKTKMPDSKVDTSYKSLDQAYTSTKEQYDKDFMSHDAVDYSKSPTIKVAGGKDPGTQVPVQVLKDVIAAAKRNGVDPYRALAQVNLESSFGTQTRNDSSKNDLSQSSKTEILQGWNLDEGIRPVDTLKYLEQKGVPGVKAIPDKDQGYRYELQDEKKVDDYLAKHPAIAKTYLQHLQQRSSVPKDYNAYDAAMKRDKTGLKHYNADPRYAKNVDKYANDFKKQKEIRELVDNG